MRKIPLARKHNNTRGRPKRPSLRITTENRNDTGRTRYYSSSSIRLVRSAIILCLASDALVTPATAPYRRVVTFVRSVTEMTRRVGSTAFFFGSSVSFFNARARGGDGESSLVLGDELGKGSANARGSRLCATTDGNASRAARTGRADASEGRRSAAARRSGVVGFLRGDRAAEVSHELVGPPAAGCAGRWASVSPDS